VAIGCLTLEIGALALVSKSPPSGSHSPLIGKTPFTDSNPLLKAPIAIDKAIITQKLLPYFRSKIDLIFVMF
jgi:hypothetical protein